MTLTYHIRRETEKETRKWETEKEQSKREEENWVKLVSWKLRDNGVPRRRTRTTNKLDVVR